MFRSPFIKRVLTLVSGVVLAQALYILVLPILTRLYEPDVFGVFSQYLSVVGILSAAFCLRFDDAIYVVHQKKSLRTVVNFGLLSALVLTLLSWLFLVLFKQELSNWLEIQLPDFVYYLVPLAAFLQAVYMLLTNAAVKLGETKKVAFTQVQRNVAISGFQVGFSIWPPLANIGLALGDLLGKATGVWVLLKFTYNRTKGYTLPRFYWKTLLRQLKRFPMISAPNAVVNVSANQSTPLILIAIYDLRVAGIFYVAQRVTSAPLVLLGKAISQVYSSQLAEMKKSGVDKLKQSYLSMAKKLFFISLGPVILLAVSAPFLATWILGSEWQASGYFISLLAPALLAQMVVTPLSNVANILSRQGMMLMWDLGRLLSVLAGFYWVYLSSYSEFYAVGIYSMITAFFFLLQMMLIWRALGRSEQKDK